MEIYVSDIVRECNAKLVCGSLDLECVNFSKDTRSIEAGDVYVAIRGNRFDGNDYYEEAFSKGASVCILDKLDLDNFDYDRYGNRTLLLVDDTVKCLQQLASYKRSLYNIPVIAVTGSVGKTSTKDMIASVLSQKYRVLKTMGNNNNHIGLPLTILRLKDHEALVLEMGMNHFGEISLLSNIARPNIALITNIGSSHIGNLGSRENILKAKLEIVDGLEKDQLLIINNDDNLLKDVKLNKDIDIVTVGINNMSDYMAENIKIDNDIISFDILGKKERENDIKINVGAFPFVYNTLMAYVVGKILKVPGEKIKVGLENVELSSNRLSKFVTKTGYTLIDDTYNASYDSMEAALDVLIRAEGKRKIAVLGDMLELGEFSKDIHEKIADKIVDSNVNIVITVGQCSNYINDKLLSLGFDKKNLYHFANEKESYSLLNDLLTKGDVVLFKASHALGFTNIVNYLLGK